MDYKITEFDFNVFLVFIYIDSKINFVFICLTESFNLKQGRDVMYSDNANRVKVGGVCLHATRVNLCLSL